MLKTVISLCQRAVKNELETDQSENDSDERQSMTSKFFDGVLNLFLFIWFVAGNIWVYSKYKPHFIPPSHDPFNYCHPFLYLFAFWVITSSYIIMGIICFCICCLGMCASCTAFFVANTTNWWTTQEIVCVVLWRVYSTVRGYYRYCGGYHPVLWSMLSTVEGYHKYCEGGGAMTTFERIQYCWGTASVLLRDSISIVEG